MPHPLIFLIGYRGTGKSTVGQLLADRLGWAFVDADERIEAAGKTIADIFAAEGEPGFRDRESAVLADLCSLTRHVVATGGGVILRPGNRELLRKAGFVAWLTASPETAWARLRGDPTTAARRPNLTPKGGFDEVRTLTAAREHFYRECADFVIDTGEPSPSVVADAIFTAWNGSTSTSRP
ncbi:MAG: shikimate kinase [Gemmataceae bacterium]|nr:shikimate kinase [Gemmataceae bacterium]